MDKSHGALASGIGLLLVFGSLTPFASESVAESPTVVTADLAISPAADEGKPLAPVPSDPPEPPPPPPPPTPREVLERGVLIVVSIPSQKMFVFKDGEVWDSSDVSTGKRGHETPAGTFPILQKKVDHRSNLYDDAPMPYMQRLTWDGVALHAGRVPSYPASHGCIRLPKPFAKKLYEITNFSSTIVLVTDEALGSAKEARKLA